MSETLLNELMIFLVPAALGAAGVLVGFLWGRLKAYAKSTPTLWDDRLVEIITNVVEERKDAWMLAGKKKAEQELASMLRQSNIVLQDPALDNRDANDPAELNVKQGDKDA